MYLFNRQTSVQAKSRLDGMLVIDVLMSDTFHEIAASFIFAPEKGTVVEASAKFIRCPYDICQITEEKMDALRGITVGPGAGKAVREALGGCEGCEHLVELTMEAFRAFVQCRFRLDIEGQDNNVQKTFEFFQDQLKDTCYSYAHPDQIGEIRWWGRLPVSMIEQITNKK